MLTLLLVTSLAVAQSTVHCEPVRGDLPLVFDSWEKSGGAMPGPGTPMRQESWSLGEDLIGERVSPYLQDPVQTGVPWVFVEDSVKRERHEDGKMMRTSRYTVEVVFTHPSGEPIHALVPEPTLTLRVRCHAVTVWGIP